MRGPLSLVIDDGNGPRRVTSRTRDLRFKRSAYGGDVDLTAHVRTERNTFTDLGPGDTVTLYDGRTGAYVFRGTADQPGATAGPRGQSYDLQALGGAVRLQASTEALAYVHALDDGWRRTDSTKGAEVNQQEKNSGKATLEISWAKLFELEANDQGQFANRTLQALGLRVGRVRAEWDAGRTSANLVLRAMSGTDLDSLASAADTTATTTGGTLAAYVGGGGIAEGDDAVALRARWVGPTLDVVKNAVTDKIEGGVPDKTYWVRFWDVIVRQVLKDVEGNDIVDGDVYSGTEANTVTVQRVIRDMIGRGMCPDLDVEKVTIGQSFEYAIDALSWLDGIKMGDALNELLIFEPQLTWQVYGDEATFDAWPEEPRYVFDARDDASFPGEEISLADRVFVEWRDRRGREQRTKVTDPEVPVKMEAEPITLPDGVGSEANAQRAGEVALSLRNNPPRAGTVVVRRRLLDRWTGTMVLPHDVMPGCLVVERETGHEFRLVETEYVDRDGAVALTLGEPRRTLEQVMARLERKQKRRR